MRTGCSTWRGTTCSCRWLMPFASGRCPVGVWRGQPSMLMHSLADAALRVGHAGLHRRSCQRPSLKSAQRTMPTETVRHAPAFCLATIALYLCMQEQLLAQSQGGDDGLVAQLRREIADLTTELQGSQATVERQHRALEMQEGDAQQVGPATLCCTVLWGQRHPGASRVAASSDGVQLELCLRARFACHSLSPTGSWGQPKLCSLGGLPLCGSSVLLATCEPCETVRHGLPTLHPLNASNLRRGCTADMAASLQAAVNRQEAAEAQTQLRHLQRQQTQHKQQLEHELEQAQVRAATAVQEREAMHATLRQGGSAAAGRLQEALQAAQNERDAAQEVIAELQVTAGSSIVPRSRPQQHPLPKSTPGVKLPVRSCGVMGCWHEAAPAGSPSVAAFPPPCLWHILHIYTYQGSCFHSLHVRPA